MRNQFTIVTLVAVLAGLTACQDDSNDPQTIRETGYLSCVGSDDCDGFLCEDAEGEQTCVPAPDDCEELSCACLGEEACADRPCFQEEGWIRCGEGDDAWDDCAGKACGTDCAVCDPDDPNCNQPGTPTTCHADGVCRPGPAACEGPWDGCAGRACGDACAPCDPDDPNCDQIEVETHCNPVGECVEGDVLCADQWEPCVDRACGEVCSPCDPEDPNCPQIDVDTRCDSGGACVEFDQVICPEPMACEDTEDLACAEGQTCCVDRCCGSEQRCCAGVPIPPGEGSCIPVDSPCPMSRRDVKTDIRYLSASDADRISRQVQEIRLATYHYKGENPSNPKHLGFIIDDEPGPHTVAADGSHVNLYGYTSLTVATLQVQARKIEQLEAELAALREEIRAMKPTPQPDVAGTVAH